MATKPKTKARAPGQPEIARSYARASAKHPDGGVATPQVELLMQARTRFFKEATTLLEALNGAVPKILKQILDEIAKDAAGR